MHGNLPGNVSDHREKPLSLAAGRWGLLKADAAHVDVDSLHLEAGHGLHGGGHGVLNLLGHLGMG